MEHYPRSLNIEIHYLKKKNSNGLKRHKVYDYTSVKPCKYIVHSESAPRQVPDKPQRNAPVSPGGPVAQPLLSPDAPKVVHLQYNSPISLYSDQNIQETFRGQTQAIIA